MSPWAQPAQTYLERCPDSTSSFGTLNALSCSSGTSTRFETSTDQGTGLQLSQPRPRLRRGTSSGALRLSTTCPFAISPDTTEESTNSLGQSISPGPSVIYRTT